MIAVGGDNAVDLGLARRTLLLKGSALFTRQAGHNGVKVVDRDPAGLVAQWATGCNVFVGVRGARPLLRNEQTADDPLPGSVTICPTRVNMWMGGMLAVGRGAGCAPSSAVRSHGCGRRSGRAGEVRCSCLTQQALCSHGVTLARSQVHAAAVCGRHGCNDGSELVP